MRNVFISYAKQDLETATRIERALSSLGYSPMREESTVYAGGHWANEVRESIASNHVLLVLWSRHAAGSHFVQFEWTMGIALGKNIIPCLLDDTPLAPVLNSYPCVSLQDIVDSTPKVFETIGRPSPEMKPEPLKEPLDNLAGATMVTMGAGTTIPGQPSPTPASDAKSGGAERRHPSDQNDLMGSQIAGRYDIIRLLGRGGMGAVYQAYDRELDRNVALKVIRADLVNDPDVLKRFKREIQLSSTVTHKNVLRVYDLGESEGIKFLTMQYVEGDDLAHRIKHEGHLPIPRLLHIFRQVCQGLAAAHEQGVLHRDLKPSNIMIDKEENVYLTDFGLARSMQQSRLTQSGAVMGTPHYMSPEQVKGQAADKISDIYSLGIILYEMATGSVPYSGETMYEVMIQRVQKPPRPATELNPEIPAFLDKVIKRSMSIEKLARYATIEELLADLDQGAGTGHVARGTQYYVRHWRGVAAALHWRRFAIALPMILLLFLAGWWLWNRGSSPSTMEAIKPVSVLIADFQNRSGVQQFDGVLEQALESGLEGASFIAIYNRGQARKVAAQLKEGATALDETLARLVAVREGINIVVGGTSAFQQGKYEITINVVEAHTGQSLFTGRERAANKEKVLEYLGKLSAKVRKTLGDLTPESEQLAEAESFTAGSLEAARSYALAQEMQWTGQWEEAISHYKEALALDPGMGRALAGIAVMHRNLGQREKAIDYFKQAMAKIDRMTDRERYRTRGGYFVTVGDNEKAIEEYSALIKKFPADFAGHANLALSYHSSRKMAAAFEEGRRAIEIFPKNIAMRTNLALLAMYAGDFAAALKESAELRKENSYGSIFVCQALSELGLGRVQEAVQTYLELEKQGPSEASIAAMGLADVAIYEGRFEDSVRILRSGIQQDRSENNIPAAARKAAVLARVLLLRGQRSSAIAQAEQAVGECSDVPVIYTAATAFLEGDRDERAVELAGSLGNSLRTDSRAYGKLIEGEAMLKQGKGWEAIRLFQESQKLADSWPARLARGRAYLSVQAYTEAYSEFERCQKRLGESTALFLDDIPTLAALPPLYYYMGQAQEGLGSPAAQESYRKFVNIKEKSEKDSMVNDARRRLAAK